MKNLLVVVRSISFGVGVGGMEKAATQHIYEMHSKGYNIYLMAPASRISGEIPSFIKYIDIKWPRWDKYKILMTMGIAYYKWCKQVAMSIKSITNDIDIVHFHGASAGALAFFDRHMLINLVTVVNPHGMEEFGSGSILRLANRLFTRHLLKQSRFADAVIATDSILVKNVKKNLKVPPEKIYVIPNTIDISLLKRIAERAQKSKDINIVSVGRIEYNKGYDLLAMALANLKAKNKITEPFSWHHYGNGKMKNKIIELSKKNSVPLTIHVGASDKEVQSAVANSCIFVQPSRYEGSSLTTLEAMTHGALIVAMPVGGIPDKIFNTITGFLCKTVTVEELENSLSEALKNLNNEKIRNNAKEYVTTNFDITVSTRKYDELYEGIMTSKGKK